MIHLCLFSGHHRSIKRAKYDVERGWRSVCRHCDRPMIRIGPQNWRLENEPVAPE